MLVTWLASRKMPVNGVQFSNQEFSLSIARELPEGLEDGELKLVIEGQYQIMVESLDRQFAQAEAEAKAKAVEQAAQVAPAVPAPAVQPVAVQPQAPVPPPAANGYKANGNGNGNGGAKMASPNQARAVFGSGLGSGRTREQVIQELKQRYNVESAEHLTSDQASFLIDHFKGLR